MSISYTDSLATPGPTVLVVEDDEDTVTLVMAFLQGCGYGAVAARSASEALDVLRAIHVDAILTDYELGPPVETGTWMLGRAHQEGLLSKVTLILICTGAPHVSVPAAVPQATVLRKPLDYDAVRTTLVRTLQYGDTGAGTLVLLPNKPNPS